MPGKKKKVKATELKDIRTAYVSYVKEPATGIQFSIIKEKDNEIIENECYTDSIENEGSGNVKKTFKEMLLSLNPFKKMDDDLSKEDKIFIKEVGGMNIAKKIQETLDSINKRLSIVESNGTSSQNVTASIEALQKEAEGKEGTEKETLDKKIVLMKQLEGAKKNIEAYENQIKSFKSKIEEAEEDDDIEILESIVTDKEIILKGLKSTVLNKEKEIEEFNKENPDNTNDPDNKNTNKNTTDKDSEAFIKLSESVSEVSKRLESLENRRQESNKMTIEIDKSEIGDGCNDPEKEEFWKGSGLDE